MTRAKDELTLTCARRRMIRGRTTPQAASRFLDEIAADSVRREDTTTPLRHFPAESRAHRTHRGGFYADVDERASIETMELEHAFPPEYEHLREGCLVRHPKFGVGQVVRLSQRWPETRATIHFAEWGPKKIILSKTRVELVDDD